jgi:hypothetical protein
VTGTKVDPAHQFPFFLDLHMMVLVDGKERTEVWLGVNALKRRKNHRPLSGPVA